MNTSSPSKRIKLDPSPSLPSPNDQNPKDTDDLDNLEQEEHCTICLQSFLDRTIIPVCAHEFCLECILLWSEQSRKCPLCSRSFDNSYLIHRIRSQYDYQKHYLPPSRSSPLPTLTGESRANALRNTRRERQWGRRERQQRQEADQLERAIARRRWIYQHHLYAKHIASNQFTRYRPFPTPTQFAASPDLISRMTTFLRRELRVWSNLDVEFLTTYTISLMKSIDIRSESAVKLLSEFLDLDTPYTSGARHVNAEHFAHEIYSYLRSPYRDLNMYDQTAQYDAPPETSPPQEIERGSRWSAKPSPSRRSRSRSNSRYRSPIPHRKNSAIHSAVRHGRDSSAEARREEKPSRRHSRNRSPRSIPPGREYHDPCNHPSGRSHNPPDGVQDILRNGHSQAWGMSYPEASSSVVLAENQDNNFPIQSRFRGDGKGNGQATENMEEFFPVTEAPKMKAPQGDDSAAALAVGDAGVTRLIDVPLVGTGDGVVDYVDKLRGGSSANPQPSRKRLAGLSVHVHPRNRTLSESVQSYLSRPAVPRHPTKKLSVSGKEQPTRVSDTGTTGRSTTDTRPKFFLRLTDGPTDPDIGKLPPSRKATVERTTNCDPSTPNDATSEQQHHGCRSQSCVFLLNRCFSTAAEHPNAITQHSDHVDDEATRSHLLPSMDDEVSRASPSADRNPGWLGFPPMPSVTPLARTANANVALSHALASEGYLVDGLPESVQTRHGGSRGQGSRFHTQMGAARGVGDQARPGDGEPAADDTLDLHSDLLGRYNLLDGAAALLDDHGHKHGHDYGRTNMDTSLGVEVSTGATAAVPSFFPGGERVACGADGSAVGGLRDGTSRDNSTSGSGSGSGSGSMSTSTSTPTSMSTQISRSKSTDADASEVEMRLRTRARLHVRLAAMKGTETVGFMGSVSGLGSGLGLASGLGMDPGSGPGRRGVEDDSPVRRADRVRQPSVGVAISGDRNKGWDGDGDGVRDEGGIRDKDRVKDKDKLRSDRGKERQREVALRGVLRERAVRRGEPMMRPS